MRYLFSIIFSICGVVVAQNQVSFSGIVFDPNKNMPINDFHVGILEHPEINIYGTPDGYFSLKAPKELENDTFYISSVGYELYKAPIKKFLNNSSPGTLRIALKPIDKFLNRYLNGDSIFLDSQVFLDNAVLGREMMMKVIERIPNNYDPDGYELDGFFRETLFEDQQPVKLYEANVHVADSGYTGKNGKDIEELIQIKAFRESENFASSVYLEDNGLATLFLINDVRYPKNVRLNIFSSLDKFDFHLDSVFYYGTDLCYHITISNPPNYPRIAGGQFFVRCDDYGLLYSNYFLKVEQKEVLKVYKGVEIKYQEYSSILYPEFIKLEHLDNTVNRKGEVIKTISQTDEIYFYNIQDYLTVEVPREVPITQSTDFSKENYPYNEIYWNEHDEQKFKRESTTTSSLNAKKPLNEQFIIMKNKVK